MPEQMIAAPDGGAVGGSANGCCACRAPVPSRGVSGHRGLQGLHPGQSSFRPSGEQIPVPGGGLQDFLPDQGSAASSTVLPEEQFLGGFSRFSHFSLEVKKCEGRRAGECESGRALQSAHQMARAADAPEGSVPGQSSVALLGGLQSVFPGESSIPEQMLKTFCGAPPSSWSPPAVNSCLRQRRRRRRRQRRWTLV